MRTVSGRAVQILDPRPADVELTVIAHHLAIQVRFNGAIPRFYSVGEHSVLEAREVFRHLHGRHPLRYAALGGFRALLHDASEAYLGDCIAPLKRLLPEYKRIEALHMEVIYSALGFDDGTDWTPMDDYIASVDKTMFALEDKILRGSPDGEPEGLDTFAVKELYCWPWEEARDRFLSLANLFQKIIANEEPTDAYAASQMTGYRMSEFRSRRR